ncbi:Putative RNA methylase family UPF0020 [Marvinbryantia formatexigens]|nr:Putative RNA methylase family UPF0020 [Marvinbryantia formatexigens]
MLMNKYLNNLKNGVDLRDSALGLKEEIRKTHSGKTLARELAGDFSVLTDLLTHEDPKVRKNVALVIGELGEESLKPVLWEAYQRETILYIRADYLKALSHYDCTPYLDTIKARMEELDRIAVTPEEEKHVYCEQTALKTVLVKTEKMQKHTFTAMHEHLEVILITNRENREATAEQLYRPEKVRMLAGGIRFETENLDRVLPIRTYMELLFPVPGLEHLEGSPQNMAEQLVQSQLLPFLKKCHREEQPFYFRLEVRAQLSNEQKVDLVKKLARALEKESGRQLLNAPGGYEIEIRLVGNREGRFIPLLKLYTIKDRRFAYRAGSLPVSIAPVNAALIMYMVKEYLREGARVLDPFCGVGTMLIERRQVVTPGTLYGVDILEEAVQKARRNSALAHVNAHYINRDFFDFTHEKPFDEIVTNLPAAGRLRNLDNVAALYDRFLEYIPKVARRGATIVAYTPDFGILKHSLEEHGEYYIKRSICINEREGSFVVVFRLK